MASHVNVTITQLRYTSYKFFEKVSSIWFEKTFAISVHVLILLIAKVSHVFILFPVLEYLNMNP
jgi:hypothetical protein